MVRVRTAPRIAVALAVALPLLLVVAVVGLAAVVGRQSGDAAGPLALTEVPAPAAGSAPCARLLAALPGELISGGQRLARRQLAAPAPPGVLAWGGQQANSGRPSEHPVVLRCGVGRPAGLTPTSELLDVSGVQWLQQPGQGASTWVVVDRPVYVTLRLPEGIGSGAIQETSAAVTAILPARPVPVE